MLYSYTVLPPPRIIVKLLKLSAYRVEKRPRKSTYQSIKNIFYLKNVDGKLTN